MRLFSILLLTLLFTQCGEEQSAPEMEVDEVVQVQKDTVVTKVVEEEPAKDSISEVKGLVYHLADFTEYDIILYGCTKLDNPKNWEALNDSFYLYMDKLPDSMLIYQSAGIEEMKVSYQEEWSLMVKGDPPLVLSDYRHFYPKKRYCKQNLKTFYLPEVKMHDNFLMKVGYNRVAEEVARVEKELGDDRWTKGGIKNDGPRNLIARTRGTLKFKAKFNNGLENVKTIVIQFAGQ